MLSSNSSSSSVSDESPSEQRFRDRMIRLDIIQMSRSKIPLYHTATKLVRQKSYHNIGDFTRSGETAPIPSNNNRHLGSSMGGKWRQSVGQRHPETKILSPETIASISTTENDEEEADDMDDRFAQQDFQIEGTSDLYTRQMDRLIFSSSARATETENTAQEVNATCRSSPRHRRCCRCHRHRRSRRSRSSTNLMNEECGRAETGDVTKTCAFSQDIKRNNIISKRPLKASSDEEETRVRLPARPVLLSNSKYEGGSQSPPSKLPTSSTLHSNSLPVKFTIDHEQTTDITRESSHEPRAISMKMFVVPSVQRN